jgi:DsbC/DsbD-like thiol-disulfide interchange protein
VIRELGILDEHLDRHHAEFGRPVRDDQWGVAYPNVFLLDADGNVVRKRVHRNYRIRDTGAGLFEEMFGGTVSVRGAEAVVDDEVVQIRAYLDSPTYRWYQRLRVVIDVAVQDGYHIYGTPIPEGYVPLSVAIEPIDGLEVGETAWPRPHPFRVNGLPEEFWVHEGTVRGSIPLMFTKDGTGDHRLGVTVRYQVCSATACLPPAHVRFELPVREVAAVDAPAKQ